MRKKWMVLAVLVVLFGFSVASNAALWDRGGGLIYDDILNITWLADANYAKTSGYNDTGTMNWSEANTWVTNLSYGEAINWRLPTGDPSCGTGFKICTGGEMGHLFYVALAGTAYQPITNSTHPDLTLFNNIQMGSLGWYWTSTPGPYSGRYAFNFEYGAQSELYTYSNQPVWAVHDGDVGSVVPIPGAIWLLGSGLAGLAVYRRGSHRGLAKRLPPGTGQAN